MNEYNIQFLKEYIRLDNLCKDIYNIERNGVSAYLEDMDNNHSFAYIISGWEDDYDQLKTYRHLRNHMTHDPDALDEEECTAEDVQWIEKFQTRILQSNDPLARLRNHQEQIAQRKKQETEQAMQSEEPRSLLQFISDAIAHFINAFR